MDGMEEIRETFFIECEELLEVLEAGLIAISEGEHDDETVNAVFRAVHSIKGGAGAFSLDCLVSFAHKIENVLDLVRSARLDPDAGVMNVLLRSGDVLSDLVTSARDGNDAETDASRKLLSELRALYSGEASAPSDTQGADEEEPVYVAQPISLDLDEEDIAYTPQPIDMGVGEPAAGGEREFLIKFRPYPELFAHGSEVTLLLRALSDVGSIDVEIDDTRIPLLEELDFSHQYPELTIKVRTEQEKPIVQEIFDFVDTESDLVVEERTPTVADDVEPEGTDDNLAPELLLPEQPTESVSDQTAKSEEPSAAKANASQTQPSRATVRVDVMRVDRLVNLVGELVVTQAGITEYVERAAESLDASSGNAMEEFKQLTRELQDGVMSLRTQPVKPLFQRMQRISREAGAASSKSVRLQTSGEATEVDRTVIERLADPLTHMIRNAIDHGLESSEDRKEAGKDSVGVVSLSAAHRSGRVVIEVSDDGAGINRERVRSKAIEKGLITEDTVLSNAEIDHLLFAPGFSTAAEVTNLSGRGVGMDVVKRSIQALGGRISINSVPGKGTTFSISLPLTLAVLDGMIVRVDRHTVIVPLTAIVESHKPSHEQILEVAGGEVVLSIRENLVPVVDVGHRFGYRERIEDVTEHVAILIESEGGARVALAVDDIVDQRQVVIKSLDENYGDVAGIAAATILGDGTIALILDTDELVSNSVPESLAFGAVA
ncbi:MAG: chemotaxis protein CheA [Pseudomonadota bacterium]